MAASADTRQLQAQHAFYEAMGRLEEEGSDDDKDAQVKTAVGLRSCIDLLAASLGPSSAFPATLDDPHHLLCCALLELAKLLEASPEEATKAQAIPHYERAAAMAPSRAEAPLLLGVALKRARKWSEAEEALRTARTRAAAAGSHGGGHQKKPRRAKREVDEWDEDEDDEADVDEEAEEAEREREAGRQATLQLAMLLLQQDGGREKIEEADGLLQSVGFTRRLSHAIWAYPLLPPPRGGAPHREIALCPLENSFMHVEDSVLPPRLLEAMSSIFLSPHAPFWAEHRYHRPQSGYFSYKQRFAFVEDTHQQMNAVDAAIQHIARRLRAAGADMTKVTHAEWWAHTRPHTSGHALHFDTDEGALAKTGRVETPIYSCVLFVSDGREEAEVEDTQAYVGGPTVVLSQSTWTSNVWGEDRGDAGEGATTDVGAALVYPKTNRLLGFDGRLLHGVVPGRVGEGGQGGGGEERRRVTFMVGFWEDYNFEPTAKEEEDEGQYDDASYDSSYASYAFAMQKIPKPSTEETWPGLLGEQGNWGLAEAAGGQAAAPAVDGVMVLAQGAWTKIAKEKKGDKKGKKRGLDDEEEGEEEEPFSAKVTHRFLLRSRRELDKEMLGDCIVSDSD